jgi:hypothetical protein
MGRTKGSISKAHHKGADGRLQAWQSMRIMRRFTRAAVLTTADIRKSNLGKYVKALQHAGYLRVAKACISGRAGSHEVLELIKDNGPKAPIVGNDGQVFDPNDQQFYGGQVAAQKRPADSARREISYLRRIK